MKTNKIAKILTALLAGTMVLSSASCGENSKPAPESAFEIELKRNDSAVGICGYKGNAKNLIIPATIQGLPVVGINLMLYDEPTGKSNTISLVIPEGVEYVDIYNAKNLKSVTLPSTLKVIAMSNCSKLENIDIPEGVEIIRSFKNTPLKAIKLPESLKYIRTNAFEDTKIKTVTLPRGLKYIGRGAFDPCDELEEINIPENWSYFMAFYDDSYHDYLKREYEYLIFSGQKINESVACQKTIKQLVKLCSSPTKKDREEFDRFCEELNYYHW